MCNTWLQAAETLGFTVHVSTPPGYEVEPERAGLIGSGRYREFTDPIDACRGAHLVTTDVWTSMGFEAENESRQKAFAAWRVSDRMMQAADPSAIFMHCLPAHRGEEVGCIGDRWSAERGVGRGRESPACAEGVDGIPDPGPRR